MLWFELSGFGVVGDWRASSLGHAMGLAMVAWPMSPSLPPSLRLDRLFSAAAP